MTEHPLEVFAARHAAATPLEAMEALCRRLRERSGQVQPPIGVENQILTVLRASVEVRAQSGTRGRLDLVGGRWRVQVDGRASYLRRRFVIAHEISHMLVLDTLADRPDLVRALRGEDVMPDLERLCSSAAAELLIPREDLIEQLQRVPLDEFGMSALRRRYTVSWRALLIRMADVLDAGTSVWAPGLRPSDPPQLHRVRHSSGPVWLPPGMTARHLDIDVIAHAYRHGIAREQEVVVEVSARRHVAEARAARLPTREIVLVLWPLDEDAPRPSGQLRLDLDVLHDPRPPLWTEEDTLLPG